MWILASRQIHVNDCPDESDTVSDSASKPPSDLSVLECCRGKELEAMVIGARPCFELPCDFFQVEILSMQSLLNWIDVIH